MKKFLLFLSISLLFFSCERKIYENPIIKEVWIPRYANLEESKIIEQLAPQNSKFSGNIYVYNQYLFQVETNRGIHIYKIQENIPEKIGFIKVIGTQHLSIRSNVLYTNNMNDLVLIDISDIENIKEINRMPDMFKFVAQDYPPVNSGYFECADPSKGVIVGWDLVNDTLGNCKIN